MATKKGTKKTAALPPAWVIVKALGACGVPGWVTSTMSAQTAFNNTKKNGGREWIIDVLNLRHGEADRIDEEIEKVAKKLAKSFKMEEDIAEQIVNDNYDAFGIDEEGSDDFRWEDVEKALRRWIKRHPRLVRSTQEAGRDNT